MSRGGGGGGSNGDTGGARAGRRKGGRRGDSRRASMAGALAGGRGGGAAGGSTCHSVRARNVAARCVAYTYVKHMGSFQRAGEQGGEGATGVRSLGALLITEM